MSYYVSKRPVSSQKRWCDKCKTRILHALSKNERQQDIIYSELLMKLPGKNATKGACELLTTIWKTWRQTQEIITSPYVVFARDYFCCRQKILSFTKFVCSALDNVRFTPDGTSVGYVPFYQVANC